MGKPEATVEMHLVDGVIDRKGWPAKMIDVGRRGAPDRECRFPEALIVYVETKATNGVLKKWQSEYHADLRALGHIVLVLWTVAHVDHFFSQYDRGVYG